MTWPRPIDWLAIWASSSAAQAAAFAPLFGNNPADVAPVAFAIGTITGLPVYAVAKIWEARR